MKRYLKSRNSGGARWAAAATLMLLAVVVAVCGQGEALAAEAGPEALIDTASESAYHPLNQCLVVRTGTGLGGGKFAANEKRDVVVWGSCGVPSQATAVVLNAKVYGASSSGQVFVYPVGHTASPAVVNVQPVQTVNNMVTVALGSAGDFSVKPSVSSHMVLHVAGYFAPLGTVPRGSGLAEGLMERLSAEELERFLSGESPSTIVLAEGTTLEDLLLAGLIDTASDSVYHPLNQCLVVRTATGLGGTKYGVNENRPHTVRGSCGVPLDATAVVMNVKVYSASSSGQVSVYPFGHTATPAVLNVQPGQTVNNMVTVAMGSAGDFSVKPSVSVHAVMHTVGYFSPGAPPPAGSSAEVPKTGQTTSYAAGDDGDLQKGVAWPVPRFTDNANGTVTDNLTGLIWLKDASCAALEGTNANGQGDWATALTASAALANGTCSLSDGSMAGDWRLPNRFELESLLDLGFRSPALSNAEGTAQWTEGDAFSDVQWGALAFYYSSTTYAPTVPPLPFTNALLVYLANGHVTNGSKTDLRYLWPVRGGQ